MSPFLLIAFWGGTALVIVAAVRFWNAPLGHQSYARPPWWPWGRALWQGYRRAIVAAALVAVSFALGLTLPIEIGVYFGLVGMLVLFPLGIIIVLFNQPKFLVPPACRSQEGLLSETGRRRAENGD